MNAKEFCQRFGINPSDSAWVLHKHSKFEGDAKAWFDLVGANLIEIPATLAEAIKPVVVENDAVVKPIKNSKKEQETV